MPNIHLDFETYSQCDLKKAGPWRYSVDTSTGIICLAYAIDDGPVVSWYPGCPAPEDLLDLVGQGSPVYAHNSQFEASIWENLLPFYFPVPDNTPEWRCTQAIAQFNALPGALDAVAGHLRLDNQKDKEGNKIMRRNMKVRDFQDIPPEDLIAVVSYCKKDVQVEREIHRVLGDLPEAELAVWKLDQKMNRKGVWIDKDLITSVMAQVSEAQKGLNERLPELTGGEVTKPTQVARIIKWVNDQGVDLPNTKADTIETFLKMDLPEGVREVLQIRQNGSKASTAKYQRMLDMEVGGIIRGQLRYHGATTGRWAGAGVQLQNLPRPMIEETDKLAEILSTYGDFSPYSTNIFSAAKDCVRSAIVAGEGMEFIVSDYSAIEARVLAWLADERWKLEAFEAYDNGEGHDQYKLSYSKSFGVPADRVDKEQRQIGKVQELALGYGGGPGAYASMASIYGVNVADYYDLVSQSNPRAFAKAEKSWELRGRVESLRQGMDERTWKAAETIKIAWRWANPQTTRFWYDLMDDAFSAVRTGVSGNFSMRGRVLRYLLPSGRHLSYWDPEVREGRYGEELAYSRPKNGKMLRASAYAGKICENVTQAVARDVMASAMLRLDHAGADLRLTVHDEILAVSEANNTFMFKLVQSVMSSPKGWMAGLPLAVEAFTSYRYKK